MIDALYREISSFRPLCRQEQRDREQMLRCIERYDNILLRDNDLVHMTASAWIVNPSRDRVLMVYHNIYGAWSWTGGHADGDPDLYAVALREAQEETGLSRLERVQEGIFSIESVCVLPHVKKESYVSSHIHLNATYLFSANENDTLKVKPDENSAVAWLDWEQSVGQCPESHMVPIYSKLWARLK